MNGSLNLIGHNGLVQQTVQSHDKPISVLRCHGERVIVGSYDTVVSVHRSVDLVSVNSLHIHDGNITDIVCVEVIRLYTHTHVHTHTHAHTHTHTHTHTYITHVHTYTHTHLHMYVKSI